MLGEVLALLKADWVTAAACILAAAAVMDRKIIAESRAVWMAALLFFVLTGFGRMKAERTWAMGCLEMNLDGKKYGLKELQMKPARREKGQR